MARNNGGRALLVRLRRHVDARLQEIEAAEACEGRTAAEREKDTRTLATLVGLTDKIVQLERQAGEGRPRIRTAAERQRLREDLARRVIAMLEQVRGEPLPEGP